MGLLVLCAGTWGLSYEYRGWLKHDVSYVAYENPGAMTRRTVSARLELGSLRLYRIQVTSPVEAGERPVSLWDSGVKALDFGRNREFCEFWVYSLVIHKDKLINDSLHIPFWLPTLWLILACVYVWRTTRPSKPGGAFPVEVLTPK